MASCHLAYIAVVMSVEGLNHVNFFFGCAYELWHQLCMRS